MALYGLQLGNAQAIENLSVSFNMKILVEFFIKRNFFHSSIAET